MLNSNSHPNTKYTIFLGITARVAQLVVANWSNDARSGETLLGVSRHNTNQTDLCWDMAMPPPPFDLPSPPVVVCFAGITPRSGADLSDNTTLALAAQQAAAQWGARHVFHLSSAAVYGDPGSLAIGEIPDPTPLGAYGHAKLEMERALAHSQTPHTVLRLGNVAGAGQPFDAAAQTAMPKMDRFADGSSPRRSYIGPRSLAHVLSCLSRLAHDGANLPQVLNVAAPQPTAMAEILLAMGREWQWVDAAPSAIHTVHLDTTRLSALCPLDPDTGTAARLVGELQKDAAQK